MEHLEFDKADFQMLVELNQKHKDNVARIEKLEKIIEQQNVEINRQKKTLDTMVWASSKVGFFVAGLCGAVVWLGNWLMDVTRWNAVKAFFDTINKGQ